MAYIYVPVPTTEMDTFVTDWNAGRASKNKPAYTVLKPAFTGTMKAIRRGLGYGCLSGVPAGSKLYVLAHGNPTGSARIGASRGATLVGGVWSGGTMKAYDPPQLAAAIQSEGLPTSFQDLRVFACGSALTPAGQTQSFAERLKIELNNLGYNHIQVSGYGGAAFSQYATLYSENEPHKTVLQGRAQVPAQNARTVF